jgi:hypothetical protein
MSTAWLAKSPARTGRWLVALLDELHALIGDPEDKRP